ncbi:hypothetical protein AADZ90_003760 [Aestuariibius sp. 2305UL40-4]|uniref:hypothetical protein n=1 Tax=Aestuariibius violaceus TaxID=3234132 RepID=UPI00345E74EA
MDPDADLKALDRDALERVARDLRAAIRQHRDSSGHGLCWYHPEMWALLPDGSAGAPDVPSWDQFMKGCVAYRASLDAQGAHLRRVDTPFVEETNDDQA